MNAARATPVLTGWHALTMIVGFFLIVMAVDIGMAVVAYRTHPGEVTAKPYEEGLAFNHTLARRREERALDWRAKVEASSLGVGQMRVRVTIADRSGAAVRGLALKGVFERPATEAGRLSRAFVETGPGVYDTTVADVPGAWDMALTGHDRKGDPFDAQERLTWR